VYNIAAILRDMIQGTEKILTFGHGMCITVMHWKKHNNHWNSKRKILCLATSFVEHNIYGVKNTCNSFSYRNKLNLTKPNLCFGQTTQLCWF
jgi:hypothetical protein